MHIKCMRILMNSAYNTKLQRARSAEFAKRKGFPSVRWVYLTVMPRSLASRA